jgi:hypothetical protein
LRASAMACSLSLVPPQDRLLLGWEHGRTIPLSEVDPQSLARRCEVPGLTTSRSALRRNCCTGTGKFGMRH